MNNKTILVTGGAGYIGSHTVKALESEGFTVVIYDNLTTGHREFVKNRTFVQGDIGDKALISKTLEEYGVDMVIHFAANAYVGESVVNPMKYYTNNIVQGISFLNTLVEARVKKIVFSSSCATYGIPEKIPISEETPQSPINPYGRTKLMFEQILQDYDNAYGLKSISLRYFNAAGADEEGEIGEWHDPETHVIPLLLRAAAGNQNHFAIFGTDFPTRDGTCIRDYIHVTDLANAHVSAVKHLLQTDNSDVFNLGTGCGVSVRELIDTAEKVTGREISVVESERRPGDPAVLVADAGKAKEILNWEAKYSSIENIIQTAWNWEKKRKRT